MITLRKFISMEVVVACLTFLIGGGAAWVDVKEDIAINTTTIADEKETNKERYEDLKDGQKTIQALLNQLLIDEAKKKRESR